MAALAIVSDPGPSFTLRTRPIREQKKPRSRKREATVSETFASMAVTYAEIRTWAVWLNTFTASDLADAMGVDHEVGVKGIKALVWHGIMEGTGDFIDGPYGEEEIYSYVPIPGDAPRCHPRGPDPVRIAVSQMGGLLLFNPRGLPVRIRTERDMRRILSTAGAAAKHRQREKAYEKQEQARMDAAERQRIKARKEAEAGPKWKRKKKKSVAAPSVKGLY